MLWNILSKEESKFGPSDTNPTGYNQYIMFCFQRFHHIPINTLSTNDIYETSSINIDNDLGIDNTRSIIELSSLS